MPDCVFSMDPHSAGEIKIVQCGGDGSVTAEATTDYAKGTVFVTKTCTHAVPDEGIVACGPTTVAIDIGRRRPSAPKLLVITTTVGGLGAAGGDCPELR